MRALPPSPAALLRRHGLEARVPPGWRVRADPLHFLDAAVLRFETGDGLVLFLEITARSRQDPAAQVALARRSYLRAFPGATLEQGEYRVGPYPAVGFVGQARRGPRRIRFFYRALRAGGRFLSLQGQAPAAVWARHADAVAAFTASLRLRGGGRFSGPGR